MKFPLERARPEGCLSDLQIDRIVAGEIAAAGEAEVHLRECASCRARLEELRREFDAFDLAPPQPAPLLQSVPMPPSQPQPAPVQPSSQPLQPPSQPLPIARPRRGRRWVWAGSLSTLAVAAALMLMLGRSTPPPSHVRLKGGLQLELIARHRSGAVEQLLPGGSVSPGEAVRFRVGSPRAGHLAIVGIDAAHAITPYAPASGSAMPFGPARDTILDGSIILDETLGPERIVALLCPGAVPMDQIVTAAKQALSDAHDDPAAITQLPIDCAQATRLMIKRPAP